jgi:uncharacterized membrane protein YfcA
MILSLILINILNFLSLSFACSSDSDCPNLNICSSDDCVHKSLYPPAAEEIIGTILIVILGALANAGGLGGGIFMIPLLILMFFFTTHEAVPLSSIFVFGGSLIAFGLRFKQKHPTRYRPVIFYEMIMVLISPLLVGTTLGVLLNQMFPEWLIQAILTIVLGYTGITIAKK